MLPLSPHDLSLATCYSLFLIEPVMFLAVVAFSCRPAIGPGGVEEPRSNTLGLSAGAFHWHRSRYNKTESPKLFEPRCIPLHVAGLMFRVGVRMLMGLILACLMILEVLWKMARSAVHGTQALGSVLAETIRWPFSSGTDNDDHVHGKYYTFDAEHMTFKEIHGHPSQNSSREGGGGGSAIPNQHRE